MTRLFLVVSVVVLLGEATCLALSPSTGMVMADAARTFASPDPAGDAGHVVYTLHIAEFIESQSLHGGVGDLTLPVVRERGGSHRSTSPWLISAVGRPADLRIVQEVTVVVDSEPGLHTTKTGLAVRFTPIQIDPVTERVLSAVAVAGMDDGSGVETELWVGAEPVLAAMVEQTSRGLEKGLYRRTDHEHLTRYAVYVAARPVSQLSTDVAIGVRAFRSLGDPLSSPGPGSRADTAAVTVRHGSPPIATLTWRGWLSEAWRGTMVLPLSAGGPVQLAAERLLFDETMWLGFHTFVPHDRGAALGAISVGERVAVSPRLTMGVGYAPIVYSFQDGEPRRAFWWVDAAYGERSALLIRYGYVLYETDGQPTVSLGWRWELPR